MAKKNSTKSTVANRFSADDISWETDEQGRLIGWIGPKDAEHVGLFGTWDQVAEALNAHFELANGDVYRYHETWKLPGGAWGGLHCKFDPKDEDAPANMRSAGYLTHGYQGDLLDSPVRKGWTEFKRESWQNILAKFQEMREPELGEDDATTKARAVNRKMNAMTLLCAGYSLKLMGTIWNEKENVSDVEKTIAYYQLCKDTLSHTVEEARKIFNDKTEAKKVYRTDGKIGANPEMQAAVLKVTEFLPLDGGGQIAVVDLLGHTVRGCRNGLLLGGTHEVDEKNLSFVVTHIKRNRLEVVIVA